MSATVAEENVFTGEIGVDEALALLDEIEMSVYEKYGVSSREELLGLVSRGVYRYEDIFLDLARLDFIDYVRRSIIEEKEKEPGLLGSLLGHTVTPLLTRIYSHELLIIIVFPILTLVLSML